MFLQISLLTVVGIMLLCIGLLFRLWIKSERGILTKFFFSLLTLAFIWTLSAIAFNLKDWTYLEPIDPPKLDEGNAESRKATEAYLLLLQRTNISERDFHQAVGNLAKAGKLSLPIDRPKLLLGAGVLGQELPPDEEFDYSIPAANTIAPIKREIDKIKKESQREPTNAIARIYLLLRLGNLYIQTDKPYEFLSGQAFLTAAVEALEANPQLAKSSYIQEELRKAENIQEHYINARIDSTKLSVYLLEKQLGNDRFAPFIYNKSIIRSHLDIKKSNTKLKEEEAINLLKIKTLLSLQIPTIKANYQLGLSKDIKNNPETLGINALKNRIGNLIK